MKYEPFIAEELSVKLYREFQTTKKSYQSGSYSTINVNNNDFITQYPITKINFIASVTNPILSFYNNTTKTDVTIPGSYINGDFIILDSRTKLIKKNNTILLNLSPSLFPVIEQMKTFKITIDKTKANLELTYTDVETRPILTRSKDSFNLNFQNKNVEITKEFYNSTHKSNINLYNSLVSFDVSLPVADEEFLKTVNSNDTFKLVYILENSNEFNVIQRVLCNCNFTISTDAGENSLVKQKLQGLGVLLGDTPKLHDLFYESSSIQVVLTNTTKNLIYEIPFAEVGSIKFNTQYKEKKIFRSKPKKILESMSINLDLNNILTDTRIKDWIGDNLNANINLYNANGSIPISITDVVIENPSWNPEKDGLIKQQFTLSGNL